MKNRLTITALLALNLILLLGLAAQPKSEVQESIRARAFELVDANGQTRASLLVETNGEAVFRMRDSKGTIRVKLGASEEGSGLLLLDDSTNPGLHALAKRGKTTLSLKNQDGKERTLQP